MVSARCARAARRAWARWWCLLGAAVLGASSSLLAVPGLAQGTGGDSARPLAPSARRVVLAWNEVLEDLAEVRGFTPATLGPANREGIRGITIGPIENALHPGVGYGTPASAQMMRQARRMGANWVSLTPFGRVWDLDSTGVSLTFETPFEDNREAVTKAVRQAHAEGLRVLLVPHLWVESGGWRGEIDPGSDESWTAWETSYRRFILAWAKVAESARVDLFSVGVELRSWVTTARAPSFASIIRDVRRTFSGPLTYAGNWDDIEETVIVGELDLIGINAFYPLTDKSNASLEELRQGGREVGARVQKLAERWERPVIFTEFGYTARPDPALRPWEWPEHVGAVVVDERAQAQAYHALMAGAVDQPAFAGFFLWRYYANPDDASQEPVFGFCPRGKLAEIVLRDAFATTFAIEGPRSASRTLAPDAARLIGVF